MNTKSPQSSATMLEGQLLERLHDKLAAEAAGHQLTDLVYRIVESPIGKLLVAKTQLGLVRVAFEIEGHDQILDVLASKVGSRVLADTTQLDGVARQLDEYFEGHRQEFTLDLDLQLSTQFRRQVQLELGHIAYGQTWSYKEMAENIGKPNAVRAVGTACATNPLPIVLPCHRVLRTDGSLGGYLGGLETKVKLLELENPEYGNSSERLF